MTAVPTSSGARDPSSPGGDRGRRLRRLFAARAFRRRPVQVTLVDRATHHLFQPLLYQCATGVLSEGQDRHAAAGDPAQAPQRRLRARRGLGFDVEARIVHAMRPTGGDIEFPYDDLIPAAGVRQSYFGHDEFAKFAPGMKTPRTHPDPPPRLRCLRDGTVGHRSRGTPRWLTFALVGAGPTGVELAGQIREVATSTLSKQFHDVDPTEAKVLLFDGGDAPLAPFGPKLSGKAAATLTRLGVELHLGSIVTDVNANGLVVRGPDGASTSYQAGTAVGRRGGGAAGRRRVCEGDRRRAGPGRADQGPAGSDPARPSGDLRGR